MKPGSEIKAFFKAFKYAARGVAHCIKNERNMRFHLCAAVTVLFFMGFYEFTNAEKCSVFLCIGIVFSAELINTAVEAAVDMHGEKPTPAGKAAKDCAAGAVLTAAAGSVLCGLTLFSDKAGLSRAADFFASYPPAAPALAIWAAAAFIFIFGSGKKHK